MEGLNKSALEELKKREWEQTEERELYLIFQNQAVMLPL